MKRSGMSILLKADVYARHGRELMGCDSTEFVEVKSPIRDPVNILKILAKVLADGKGVAARHRLKEARAQSYEPTNRNMAHDLWRMQ
jgi:hypothetical protein